MSFRILQVLEMDSSIAIIPARSGSKRIPDKNIKDFKGKPIVAYAIEAAKQSKLFQEVMVSTDSPAISAVARENGAQVPFLRKAETSGDYATIEEVIAEVLQEYAKLGRTFEHFCCILPTSPLLTRIRLQESWKIYTKGTYQSLFPVVRYSYPVQRALRFVDGRVQLANPKYIHSRSQDLEPHFHDAGMFYWMQTEAFVKELEIFSSNSGMIELPEMEVQDIDTMDDWLVAEWKYMMLDRKQ